MGLIVKYVEGRKKYDFRTIIGLLILFAFFFVPLAADPYVLHLFIVFFIWAVVASAWNLIMGYSGIFSFGQLAFFALGAYTAGLVEVYGNVNPWIGLVFAGFFAGLFGFIIGFPCLRLKGLYIVLVTLAFHNVIPIFIKVAGTWTGGDVGLMGMPHYSLFGFTFAGSKVSYYYLAFAAFLVFNFIIYRIIHSNLGLSFVALRDSEAFAESLGVNRVRCNLAVFVISACITGIMGAIYVHYLKVATPRLLELEIFASALMMMVIGGLGQFAGPLLGAFAVTFLNEFLRTAGPIRPIMFGSIIIIVTLLFPGGLSRIVDAVFDLFGRMFRGAGGKSG